MTARNLLRFSFPLFFLLEGFGFVASVMEGKVGSALLTGAGTLVSGFFAIYFWKVDVSVDWPKHPWWGILGATVLAAPFGLLHAPMWLALGVAVLVGIAFYPWLIEGEGWITLWRNRPSKVEQ